MFDLASDFDVDEGGFDFAAAAFEGESDSESESESDKSAPVDLRFVPRYWMRGGAGRLS